VVSAPLPFIQPAWPAPPQVGALMSTRQGGVSVGCYTSLNLGRNLGRNLGDRPDAVAHNRAMFVAATHAKPVWLHLVHGATVLQLTAADAERPAPPADAAWTSEPQLACIVTAADCLPALFCLRDGSAVAAAHAGWRGLAAGVLRATVQALCAGTGAAPADVLVWLGPCIGPRHFEVGADVVQAFAPGAVSAVSAVSAMHFASRPRADGSQRWLADLPQLAVQQLRQTGVQEISVDGACTFEDASRFFSFRRDGVTGRMAAAVWRR
jgi:polyphenol oxidase